MPEPTNLMRKQAARLFPDSEEEQAQFLNSLLVPAKERQSAVIWTGADAPTKDGLDILTEKDLPSWLPERISFLAPQVRVGKTSLFESGAIYPMDVSSIFTASAMLPVKAPRRVLDMCAAPGGKTLFASVMLTPGLVVSNEVIGKRLGILRHNLKKTGRPNLYTQSLDPAELASVAPERFDLAIVDAPCSGQSLLAKGIDNPGCFHPNIIKGNAKRQIRILSKSSECVAPGGYLFYSTCTFARQENEGAIEKFLKKHDDFTPVEVPHLSEFRSELSEFCSYRIYPHRETGSGGFTCLLKKNGESKDLPELPEALVQYPTI